MTMHRLFDRINAHYISYTKLHSHTNREFIQNPVKPFQQLVGILHIIQLYCNV